MARNARVESFPQELYISHSQIFTYLNCSLRYRFKYVEKRIPERISINLPFGASIHTAIEMFYRSLKKKGEPDSLEAICKEFSICLELELRTTGVPVIFKKEAPDRKAVTEMGKAMLKVFYEENTVKPEQIVEVELPLSAPFYTDEGKPTDFLLVGIIDLLLMNEHNELIVIDNKTVAKPMAQGTADDSNQMAAYSYLLAANKYVFPTSDVKCRFDVLRKLKTPKVEHVETVRTADQRRRFAKIATAVLSAIDAGVHMPQQSWLCGDCEYSDACKAWHKRNQ